MNAGYVFLVLFASLVMTVSAQPACQKYDLAIYGGQHGLEEYPYTRSVTGLENQEGVRASITLYAANGKDTQGLIYFINDDYLRSFALNEFQAAAGKSPPPKASPFCKPQLTAQPLSLLSTFVSLLNNCVTLSVQFETDCKDASQGTTKVVTA